jgi:hypothetical protein
MMTLRKTGSYKEQVSLALFFHHIYKRLLRPYKAAELYSEARNGITAGLRKSSKKCDQEVFKNLGLTDRCSSDGVVWVLSQGRLELATYLNTQSFHPGRS